MNRLQRIELPSSGGGLDPSISLCLFFVVCLLSVGIARLCFDRCLWGYETWIDVGTMIDGEEEIQMGCAIEEVITVV